MAGFLACGSLSGVWPSRSPSGRVDAGLSAYSCGGSRRFGRRVGRTAFPILPDLGTIVAMIVDERDHACQVRLRRSLASPRPFR